MRLFYATRCSRYLAFSSSGDGGVEGCPFETIAGATQEFGPEVAEHQIEPFGGSGAGFSEYFSRPAYQDKVVFAEIKSLNGEHVGLFNPSTSVQFVLRSKKYELSPRWSRLS